MNTFPINQQLFVCKNSDMWYWYGTVTSAPKPLVTSGAGAFVPPGQRPGELISGSWSLWSSANADQEDHFIPGEKHQETLVSARKESFNLLINKVVVQTNDPIRSAHGGEVIFSKEI